VQLVDSLELCRSRANRVQVAFEQIIRFHLHVVILWIPIKYSLYIGRPTWNKNV
jgi:hypothetical protein